MCTLQMHIAPNAQYQPVLALALWLVTHSETYSHTIPFKQTLDKFQRSEIVYGLVYTCAENLLVWLQT